MSQYQQINALTATIGGLMSLLGVCREVIKHGDRLSPDQVSQILSLIDEALNPEKEE